MTTIFQTIETDVEDAWGVIEASAEAALSAAWTVLKPVTLQLPAMALEALINAAVAAASAGLDPGAIETAMLNSLEQSGIADWNSVIHPAIIRAWAAIVAAANAIEAQLATLAAGTTTTTTGTVTTPPAPPAT